MPEVYTPENKEFHKHNTGQKGSSNGRSLLTEEDVRKINGSRSLPSGSHSSDYSSSFFLDMPDWSNNRGRILLVVYNVWGKLLFLKL